MSTSEESPCEEENLKACPCVGGTLDKLVQPAILAVLAEGPIHGYRLAERLGAMPSFAGHKSRCLRGLPPPQGHGKPGAGGLLLGSVASGSRQEDLPGHG